MWSLRRKSRKCCIATRIVTDISIFDAEADLSDWRSGGSHLNVRRGQWLVKNAVNTPMLRTFSAASADKVFNGSCCE